MRDALEASFRHALEHLDPAALLTPHMPEQPPMLILAVGKAALPMLGAALKAFPEARWLAVPPSAQVTELTEAGSLPGWVATAAGHGRIVPGSHPLPTEESVSAGQAALDEVKTLDKKDGVLLLLSGGGSSLLCAPHGVTLGSKREVASQLMRRGANIFELNAVRKHLSNVKGGRLAAATDARLLNLVISDVLGDDLSVIASGPTAPDDSTFADAIAVLDRYGVDAPSARQHFNRGLLGEIPEGPGLNDPVWQRVESRVVGSNRLLLDAAKDYWRGLGHNAVVLSDRFDGEARTVAEVHAAITRAAVTGETEFLSGIPLPEGADSQRVMQELAAAIHSGQPLVLLSGGEATVTVAGTGSGGRNQEFALWLLHSLRGLSSQGVTGLERVWAISAGSDGIDGNSPAAGAVLTPDTLQHAAKLGLEVSDYLNRNDSYTFFNALGNSVITGHTGNNLNDYRAIVIQPG